MHVRRFLFVAALVAAGLAGLSHGAGAAPLQMHRAVYDLSLLKADTMSDIANVSGRMVVEWRGGPSCDGYTSLQRVVTDMRSDEGLSRNDVRLSAWEALDGKSFRYERLTYFNGQRSEKVSGRVRSDPAADEASITIDGKPPVPLSGAVLFPASANIALIDAAQAGKQLTGMKAWPMRVAYFEDGPGDSEPEFQMAFRLFPNGVVTKLELDYPDMSLAGHLVGLEYFSPGSC